jgi:hypothetical protein
VAPANEGLPSRWLPPARLESHLPQSPGRPSPAALGRCPRRLAPPRHPTRHWSPPPTDPRAPPAAPGPGRAAPPPGRTTCSAPCQLEPAGGTAAKKGGACPRTAAPAAAGAASPAEAPACGRGGRAGRRRGRDSATQRGWSHPQGAAAAESRTGK